MSTRHPIIAVTGSSGAGTTTVMKSFAHIFRREKIKAQVVEGDSFHRYNRLEMRERMKAAHDKGDDHLSHFGPEANLLTELAALFQQYGETGRGEVRKYIHDAGEAAEFGHEPGTFTLWKTIEAESDLMFYEGLHGGYTSKVVDVAKHVDLLVGVVPIINLEWIQKLHRDQNLRGYSQEANASSARVTLTRGTPSVQQNISLPSRIRQIFFRPTTRTRRKLRMRRTISWERPRRTSAKENSLMTRQQIKSFTL